MMQLFRGMISTKLRKALREGTLTLPKETRTTHWHRLIGESYKSNTDTHLN